MALITGMNKLIMSFSQSLLIAYQANELQYPQKFAQFSFQQQRLNENAFAIISANKDHQSAQLKAIQKQRRRLKL